MKKIALIFVLLTISIYVLKHTRLSFAQERIESNNFRIQFPNFNSGAGIPTSDNYDLTGTLGQGIAGEYSSTGYRVKAGFEYIRTIIPFSFSVSDIQKNFGTLSPNSFSSTSSTLTVSAGGAGGYQVTASENTPLSTNGGVDTIPDTTCNSGTCTETTAAVWNSTSTYGFGYNMSGDDVPAGFSDSTYFKQFADRSNSEAPQIVMSSVEAGDERVATITYKVNVSNTQAAGVYRNIIQFTAVPAY